MRGAIARLTCLGMLCAALLAPAGAAGPARAELERFATGLTTLRAKFTQTVKSQDGSIHDSSQGELWLHSPDKLRWEYAGAFAETIVADGRNVWVYEASLQQVTVKPQSDQAADSPLLILTGAGRLDEQFQATELGEAAGLQLLELKSLDADSEFERILLGFDADGISLLAMDDAFGQRTEIRFADVSRNAPLDPGLFRFTPPPGADVVGEAAPPD